MKKILFICWGNICRSPMAEFILKDMVEKRNIADEFTIASCATSTEEIWNGKGNPVYPPARKELEKHGISCAGKTAVQLTRDDYDKYDHLLCADQMNIRNAMRILGSDPQRKVKRMLEFSDNPRDISDPWYSGDFVTTYQDIVESCEALLGFLGYSD